MNALLGQTEKPPTHVKEAAEALQKQYFYNDLFPYRRSQEIESILLKHLPQPSEWVDVSAGLNWRQVGGLIKAEANGFEYTLAPTQSFCGWGVQVVLRPDVWLSNSNLHKEEAYKIAQSHADCIAKGWLPQPPAPKEKV